MRTGVPPYFPHFSFEILELGFCSGILYKVKIMNPTNTGVSDPSANMLPLIGACTLMYNGKLYLIGGSGSTQIIQITPNNGCTTTQRGFLEPSNNQPAVSIKNAICTSPTKWKAPKSQKYSDGVFFTTQMIYGMSYNLYDISFQV